MTSPVRPPAADEADEPVIFLLEELPTVELRLLVRQHAVVLLVCGLLLAVALVIPSDVSAWWWIPKLGIALPTAFVAFIRLSQLNGVIDELRRRAKGREVGAADESDGSAPT